MCAHSRPLWVSPTNSPVRLGVSPAVASTLTGVFNERSDDLFHSAGALGCAVSFAPLLFLPVYVCVNVGLRGLLAVALPALFVPQSCCLWVWSRCQESCLPGLCISAPPSGLDECFFFISLVVIWFSGCFLFLNCCCPSFGCVRRHSVSTYASILAGTLATVHFLIFVTCLEGLCVSVCSRMCVFYLMKSRHLQCA